MADEEIEREVMEKDNNLNLHNSDEDTTEKTTIQTQTALTEDDDSNQTSVQQTQVDIGSDDVEKEPSSPSQRMEQNRTGPQEQEAIKPADDVVGNSTATDEDTTEKAATQTQTALKDDDDSNQTAVQQTQVDIGSDDVEKEPSSPSQRMEQNRTGPQEQEAIKPADDVVGISTATADQKHDTTEKATIQTQTALKDDDDSNQTAVQQTQVDIGSDDVEKEPSSPSQRMEQDRTGPQEQEAIKPADDVVGNSTATVKILLMPEGHMMTVAFMIGLTTKDLKNHFANELRVPADFIQLTLNGNSIEDQQTLMSLGVQPHATVQFELSSLDPENYPIKPVKPQQECNMPDVITVRVQTDTDTYQDVVVEIERTTKKNPFLGGYCHKVTKTEYHHAGIQTVARRRPDRGVEMFSRDTQTCTVKDQAQQCTISTSTQMTKPGCYIFTTEDKLITPGKYITADEYHSKRLNAVIIIQTHIRRWLAKRLTTQLRLHKEMCLAWIEMEERRKRDDKQEKIRAEYNRRMNPEKKEDFALLYNTLEKWRKEEMEHINATLCGAERKAALCVLLDQEAQFIASIETHRIAAGKKSQEMAVQTFLNKCAASKQWQSFDGKMTQMDTPHIIRARELRDLYGSITLNYLSPDERLDVLLTLKNTVKEHDCKLTREILELIDREGDLLMRGVKESNLEGLRKRIATLFLQYIKNPHFNPQASKLLRVAQDPEQLRKNVIFCRGCTKFLPSSEFSLAVNTRVVRLCRRCKELDNEAQQREDFFCYKNILKHLCKDESELNPDAKIPYLIQEQDLRYLVDVVWGGQCALTGSRNLHDLLMVRWDRCYEWSPWNCLLLNKNKAAAHFKLKNLETTYATVFICNIKHKHALARKYFSKIPLMAQYLHDVDSQPVAHSRLLVTKPVTIVTK
ncbi:IQ and ubiquitin-like domain-containing protein isoform X1 [Tachysurus fulvidraco]|uniref:IQ and ubiquitin-like domain-containing protein isoform X1 n=1 Tax=Tachysurus fulvidraco TaxID=1234273 RepID=UPI001FEEAD6D|nr:IQ and ubiquitin-like domain-containing protein isoform X1 [Tachysurus fulvidraco]